MTSLEERIRRLEALRALDAATDEILEQCTRERLSLAPAVARVFAVLVDHTGAKDAALCTYDENLEQRTLHTADDAKVALPERPVTATWLHVDGGTRVQRPLEIVDEPFGWAAVWFDRKLDDEEATHALELLGTWCERLDNHLAAIAVARHKHRIGLDTSAAIREPVLDDGINRALKVLRDNVSFDDMLLVFRHQDDLDGISLHYKIVQGGQLTHDSSLLKDIEVDEFIRTHATDMIRGEARVLLDRFGISKFREEVMFTGVRDPRVIGRLVLTNTKGEFNTFERDLVERFANDLRNRIVDFNREWKQLSMCFPPGIVRRLVVEEDYRRRFLSPVERHVAVMFGDISGFTSLSEQVLRSPELIGRLVDTWAEEVVKIIWESEGVFDKMVGDCVIGLWGPPFFEREPVDLCRRAASAAAAIRAYTRTLASDPDFDQLRTAGVSTGVATGLNFCPLFVGYFGPNDNYTGFSSGMNNTARLQGLAERDEILCTESFVDAYRDGDAFGPVRQATVKNVQVPLVYRPLLETG